MNPYPETITALISQLLTLPGIGRRSAERIAVHIIERPQEEIRVLAETIWKSRKNIKLCARCRNYAQDELCSLCKDVKRDATKICVVERPSDIVNFEKTQSYKGLYHVLGGVLSPSKGIGPQDLDIESLVKHIETLKPSEVVLATGADMEGEATASFLAAEIKGLCPCITRLGFGLAVGTPMEFADDRTIQKAMDSRKEVS